MGIFEDTLPSVEATARKVLFHWNGQHTETRVTKIRRVLNPRMVEDVTHGFFDGASQQGICGAGVLFCIHHNHNIKVTACLGNGNGLKAELLALRCLLWYACRRGFQSLNIYGDSQVAINWFNGQFNINAISLEPWMDEIRSLTACFVSISCQHILREANRVADQLSKEALGPISGFMHFNEFLDGVLVDQGNIQTF